MHPLWHLNELITTFYFIKDVQNYKCTISFSAFRSSISLFLLCSCFCCCSINSSWSSRICRIQLVCESTRPDPFLTFRRFPSELSSGEGTPTTAPTCPPSLCWLQSFDTIASIFAKWLWFVWQNSDLLLTGEPLAPICLVDGSIKAPAGSQFFLPRPPAGDWLGQLNTFWQLIFALLCSWCFWIILLWIAQSTWAAKSQVSLFRLAKDSWVFAGFLLRLVSRLCPPLLNTMDRNVTVTCYS